MSDESPIDSLSGAAEQIRAFNHASLQPSGDWTYPIQTYKALGNLTLLAQRLGQAIDQATRPAVRTHEHGRMVLDDQGDPGDAVQQMLGLKDLAVEHAEALAAALSRLHSATSHMGVDTSE